MKTKCLRCPECKKQNPTVEHSDRYPDGFVRCTHCMAVIQEPIMETIPMPKCKPPRREEGMKLKIFGGTPDHVATEHSQWMNAARRNVTAMETVSTLEQVFLVLTYTDVLETEED